MKFLLVGINSKYIHSNLAVYALKSCLGDRKETVETAEYTINQEVSVIRSDIYKRKPDAIGFSCYIWNIRCVLEVAEDLSGLLRDVPVWLGGPEVSYRAEALMRQHPWIAGIIIGEGEVPFGALVGRMLERSSGPQPPASLKAIDLSGIPGVAYRDRDGKIKVNPAGAPVDFCRLPFPYADGSFPENRIVYYETSRGCPYRCSYCLSSVDRRIRLRDEKLVLEELSLFLNKKVPQVKLIDRTFNCIRSRARMIWRYLRDHDNGVTNFHFEIGADLLEEADFEILSGMRPGLVQFEIGVQTTNPQTLKAIRREASVQRIFDAVRRIAEQKNIHQHLDLIAGLPYEDYASFGRSFNDVYSLKPDQLQLGFLKVLSGTQMEKEKEKYGILHGSRPPYEVLSTAWLSYEEVCRLKLVEDAVEVFYNSRQFEGMIRYLEQKQPDAFRMYEMLAKHLDQLSSDGGKPGRRRMYEESVRWLDRLWPDEAKLHAQLLTLDYYARENTAARPSFAALPSAWKEAEKQFYIEEARQREYLPGYEAYDSRQLQHLTHMERFDWNLPEFIRTGMLKQEAVFVLFDYRNRNFRTANASVRTIPAG